MPWPSNEAPAVCATLIQTRCKRAREAVGAHCDELGAEAACVLFDVGTRGDA